TPDDPGPLTPSGEPAPPAAPPAWAVDGADELTTTPCGAVWGETADMVMAMTAAMASPARAMATLLALAIWLVSVAHWSRRRRMRRSPPRTRMAGELHVRRA